MSAELALTWDEGRFEFQRKLGNFVQYFQVNLPSNVNGVPLQLVDPLSLAQNANLLECDTTDDVPDAVLQQCIMKIDFDDGIPLLEGVPIWERFDGEHMDYYKLFKEYREMLYATGSRAITKLAATYNIAGRNLSALSKVYHWQLRVRAYDGFKRMEAERKRRYEVEQLERRHTKIANSMIDQAMDYLERHPEQLNHKIAVQMVQLGVKIGRLSVGLNPDKPDDNAGPATTNININQTLGGSSDISTDIEGGSGGPQTPKEQDLSQLQSLIHILDKSGALDRARSKIVDADYEVIDGDDVGEVI